MTMEFDRRSLLQAGAFSGATLAATATPAGAQHVPAKLSTHALDMYSGKQAAGVKLSDPAYLDTVPVRIAIFDAGQSYHVPLYFSPWSILSYRGS